MKDESKWIEFLGGQIPDGKKTKVWTVATKDFAVSLGMIQWFGRWRGYSFFPNGATVFEHWCLRDIANFIETENKSHREKNRVEKNKQKQAKIINSAPAEIG